MPFTGADATRVKSSRPVWYLTYRLSYRDLVALMAERGVRVHHTSVMRWVIRFVPEYARRWNRRAKPANSSWRVDGRLFGHGQNRPTCTERSISTARRSSRCSGQIVASQRPKRSFARRWLTICPNGLGRSHSMAMCRAMSGSDSCAAKTPSGSSSWFERAST